MMWSGQSDALKSKADTTGVAAQKPSKAIPDVTVLSSSVQKSLIWKVERLDSAQDKPTAPVSILVEPKASSLPTEQELRITVRPHIAASRIWLSATASEGLAIKGDVRRWDVPVRDGQISQTITLLDDGPGQKHLFLSATYDGGLGRSQTAVASFVFQPARLLSSHPVNSPILPGATLVHSSEGMLQEMPGRAQSPGHPQ